MVAVQTVEKAQISTTREALAHLRLETANPTLLLMLSLLLG
jgi:hypothetical protein